MFAAALVALLTVTPVSAQPPGGKPAKPDKPPPDEFKSLVKEVEEAYKAPLEVDKDVLDELRKQYRNPTPEREDKIFKEVRRLYRTTPEQEQAIERELRRAYQLQTPEQEGRVFEEVRRLGKLPPGTVPESLQTSQAAKLFARFDTDRDGRLSPEEAPEALRAQWAKWDRNRDGFIDAAEYAEYYRAGLRSVGERVAAGEIRLNLPAHALPPAARAAAETAKPAAAKAAAKSMLPDWWAELDTDRDGQIGLYEWRMAGLPMAQFREMDLDRDGLLTPMEYLAYCKMFKPEGVTLDLQTATRKK
jgi:Ca2+-binding EF-hand superfamily protein